MAFHLRIEISDPQLCAPGSAESLVEAESGVTVGRDESNDVVLADVSRTISKRHCRIEQVGGEFCVTDFSRNGTFLNSDPAALPRNAPVSLKSWDCLHVGPFSLVMVPLADTADAQLPVKDAAEARPTEPYPHDADWAQSLFSDTPVEETVRGSVGVSGFGAPRVARAAVADHIPAVSTVFVQPETRCEPIPDDWDPATELVIPGERALHGQPAPEPDRPALPAATHVTMPAETLQGTRLGVPERGAGEEGARAIAATEAFLAAAGLCAADLAGADLVVLMARAGAALRLSLGGLHDILSARAQTKQGFGIEATMIGHFGNNPLKYVGNEHEAVRALLVMAMPGFLIGADMVEHAFADIKQHQLAMLTAMRAALASVCQQLAPRAIEASASRRSLLQRLLPMARRARCWACYNAVFDHVTGGLDNDAARIFGGDFARAYRGGEPGDPGSAGTEGHAAATRRASDVV